MIAVTGATGHLGQKVVEQLLKRGVSGKDIVAVVRDRAKAQKVLSKEIQIRVASYSAAPDLEKAFEGIDRVLIISGSEIGQRVEQHTNIVNAAKKAHVKLIAYTSIPHADKNEMLLAQEHRATEKVIVASGMPYVFLRNGWYFENYLGQLPGYLESGVVVGAAGDGKISAASREDYASAAATVLVTEGHANKTYELGGDAFTLKEFAAAVSKVTGKKVEYKNMSVADVKQGMLAHHLPEPLAEMLSNSDAGIQRGDLFVPQKDLEKLIGHKPLTLEVAIKQALG